MKNSGGELTVKIAPAGRSTPVLGQRHGRGVANGEDGTDLFCVLYHQAAGQRHGVSHQPFHCGVARRPFVGHGEQRTGCNVPFYLADRSRNPASARSWNVIRCPLGLPRDDADRGQGKPYRKKQLLPITGNSASMCESDPDRVPSIVG
jgi:hypothetical protein